MQFHNRCLVYVILSCCILVAVGSVDSSNNDRLGDAENDFRNAEEGEKSKWQIFKNEFQQAFGRIRYFFTNDIPHFFSKDDPEEVSKVNKFAKKEAAAVKNEAEYIENNLEAEFKVIKFEDSCECLHYSCGCCQHIEEPSIHLNSTLCANATYLSEDIGISLTVTVNGYAIFNETVSVRNPPPVCLGVPYVKEWAEACVRFYDIDASRTHLHACAEVEARMKHVLIAKYELGCFDIGPIQSKTKQNTKQLENEQPFVMLV